MAPRSSDPIFHLLRIVPFSFLRPPRLRLKIRASFTLPSPMTLHALIVITYFLVVSGFVYDVIVKPPVIISTKDPITGTIRPVEFMPVRANGKYIIEGLSSGSGFMFFLIGIVMLEKAFDKKSFKSVKSSEAIAVISFIVIADVQSSSGLRSLVISIRF